MKKFKPDTRTLVTLALLASVSIVLTRFVVIYFTSNLRLSFGNIPIMLSGLLFGPVAGALVGAVTDIIGSAFLSPFGWYPPMTLTPVIMGLVAGLMKNFVMKKPDFWHIEAVTIIANALGTICWSTWCLSQLYGSPIWSLATYRVPFYIAVSAVEAAVMFAMFRTKAFDRIFSGRKK